MLIFMPPPEAVATAIRNQAVYTKAVHSGVPERLREYMADLISVHIKHEYETQLEGWETAVETVAAGFAKAIDRHTNALKETPKDRLSEELLLIALSLVTAGTMRWIGAAVQYKFGPKLFPKKSTQKIELKWKLTFNKVSSTRTPKGEVTMTSDDYNKVAASVLGGVTQDGAKKAVDRAAVKFNTHVDSTDFSLADVPAFELRLKKILRESKKTAGNRIMDHAMQVRHDNEIGAKWLQAAQGQEEVARFMIRRHLDRLRAQWAEEWFYYGHNPNLRPNNQLEEAIEREIWALWVVAQDIQPRKAPEDDIWGELTKTIGGKVMDRLKTLNIVLALGDKARLQDQLQKVKKDSTPKMPVRKVDGDVDTREELKNLLNWAENHKAEMVDNHALPAVVRFLPMIESIHK